MKFPFESNLFIKDLSQSILYFFKYDLKIIKIKIEKEFNALFDKWVS